MDSVKWPIGNLQVPENVTLELVHEWVNDIESYATRLRETVDGLSEEQLNSTYREGAWNVRQLVHHIADSQLNMYQRLKLALTDQNPSVPAFDEESWAVLPDTSLPIESSLKMVEGINERIVALGKTLTEEQLQRTFNHQMIGKVNVSAKMAKLAWHAEHHLAHIKLALSK